MTVTRTLCPLDCGWHHDVDNTQLPAGVHVDITAEMSVDDIRDATTMAMALRQVQEAEGVIREHLEGHELIEWVTALTTAQRRAEDAEAALQAVDAAMQRVDLGPALAGIHDTLTDWKRASSSAGQAGPSS